MADNVLKEFVVALGFTVDAGSHSHFTAAIAGTTEQITGLARAVEAAAFAVVAAVKNMADQFEGLYFASKRLSATAEGLRTFSMTVERLGGSVQGAMTSLEGFRAVLQSNPGTRGVLQSLGVNPDGSTEKVVEDLGAALRRLNDPMRARQIAGMFSLDWNTTLAVMSNDFARINAEKAALDARMGITPKWAEDATKHANTFNNAYAKVTQTFGGLRDKITDVIEQRLSKAITAFTDLFLENFDRIETVVGKITDTVIWLGERAGIVFSNLSAGFSQLYDWYNKLDPTTQDFIASLLKISAAFYILDKVMSGSPWVVAFKAAIGGIILLLDDYETYLKDPAKAALPWGKIIPLLQEAGEKVRQLASGFDALSQSILGQSGAKTALEAIAGLFAIKLLGGTIGGLIGGLGGLAGGLAGGAKTVAKGGAAAGGAILRNLPLLGPLAAAIWGMWPKTIDPDNTEAETLKRYKNATSDEQRKMLSSEPTGGGPTNHPERAAEGVLERLGLGSAGQWLRDGVSRMGSTLSDILHALENSLIPGAHAETITHDDVSTIGLPNGQFGPKPPPTTNAATRERARALMSRLQQDLGITVSAAAVAAGNAIAESGVRSIPTALVPQTNRSAFGIFQWTGDRRLQRDAFAATHPGLSPEEADIQFFEYDLKTRYPALLERMKQSTRTFQTMASDFTRNYEGPPIEDVAGHIAAGQALLTESALLGPRAVPPTPAPASNSQTTHNVNSNAQATINVQGVHDPRTVSQLVMDEWDRMHLAMARNVGGAVAW